MDSSFGSPLCGDVPPNFGSSCAVLNSRVVSVGGYDCSASQRQQVQLKHFCLHLLLYKDAPFLALFSVSTVFPGLHRSSCVFFSITRQCDGNFCDTVNNVNEWSNNCHANWNQYVPSECSCHHRIIIFGHHSHHKQEHRGSDSSWIESTALNQSYFFFTLVRYPSSLLFADSFGT